MEFLIILSTYKIKSSWTEMKTRKSRIWLLIQLYAKNQINNAKIISLLRNVFFQCNIVELKYKLSEINKHWNIYWLIKT